MISLAAGARKSGVQFESLEQRALFSTINVADYGSVVNDGIDDTP